jgi:hypothetical protein
MILFYEFLTLWSLMFYVLDIGFGLVFINTYVLSFVVSFFGLYITYYIKELNINKNIKIKGIPLILVDFIFHQLPFIYMSMNHNFYMKRYTLNQTYMTLLFICVYYLFIDIYRVYKFNEKKIRYILLLALICVYLFTTLLCSMRV